MVDDDGFFKVRLAARCWYGMLPWAGLAGWAGGLGWRAGLVGWAGGLH